MERKNANKGKKDHICAYLKLTSSHSFRSGGIQRKMTHLKIIFPGPYRRAFSSEAILIFPIVLLNRKVQMHSVIKRKWGKNKQAQQHDG